MSFRPVPPDPSLAWPLADTWPPTELARIRILPDEGITVIEIHGEADLATVPPLRDHLQQAVAPGGARLVVDLRPATFFDSSLLDLLHGACEQVRTGGGSFTLVCTDRWHLRVLHLAGLSAPHPPTSTLRDAITTGRADATAEPRSACPVAPTSPARRPVLGVRRRQQP
ncbi:STAS domain-containing protein [Streptomyces sp. NPDC058663]